MTNSFSNELQHKIDNLKRKRKKLELGDIHFDSPLLLAPMSAICNAPFRLLMEELGAGGTVSELVSCHGINHGNERTRNMLKIHEREQNIGIQLFGEDGEAMAQAALVAQEYGPKFIDINMGCPVRKVVTKGGGSALLKDPTKLGQFFRTIKRVCEVPLTIKIRTGWDNDSINAHEVVHIAHNEGVEFVAVHGRTRVQQYKGEADWNYLEELSESSPLPIIGNGDLHTVASTKARLEKTNCDALMLGRGPLRNPFLFLEAYLDDPKESPFTPSDYFEITKRLLDYYADYEGNDRRILIQMRKYILWFATGFDNASHFRSELFACPSLDDTMKMTEDYFLSLGESLKQINYEKAFMTSGHG